MITDEGAVQALENIYIAPTEVCNLDCRYCYTKKTQDKLTNQKILAFIERYRKIVNLKSVVFCGGEVFLLPDFVELTNAIINKGVFVSVITNGTINRLNKIIEPNQYQLLVSLDGPEQIHDTNRGESNFKKSVSFIKEALSLGFHTEVMFLITPESYPYIATLPKEIGKLIGKEIAFNYITEKTACYTINHPLAKTSNRQGLMKEQIIDLKRNYRTMPAVDFGCFQLSLQANGSIYGCCEAKKPIGDINTPVDELITNFKRKLAACSACPLPCRGCCEPEFLCGYVEELGCQDCREVFSILSF